jgi:hypothetical protein
MKYARRLTALPLLCLLLTLACHRGVDRVAPNFEYLTQDEIRDRNFTNVYDAIASMRANWLVVRGTDSFNNPSEVWVYYDQTKLGGVETLKAVTVNEIAYLRRYSGIDATTRWGVGHSAGVIFISSTR